LHKKEVECIYEAIEDFKMKNKDKTLSGREIEYSDKEALRLLTIAGKYMVDKNSKDNYDAESRFVDSNEFSKKEINKTIEYLKTESVGLHFIDTYKGSMKPQEYFTSTKEQKEDSSWKPNTTIGLYDASLETAPAIKGAVTVFNATKTVSPVIVQGGKNLINKADGFYDWTTLGLINKVNDVAPNLINRYLYNSTKVTNNINDFIGSGLPGTTPSSSKWGSRGFLGAYIYEKYQYLEENRKDK